MASANQPSTPPRFFFLFLFLLLFNKPRLSLILFTGTLSHPPPPPHPLIPSRESSRIRSSRTFWSNSFFFFFELSGFLCVTYSAPDINVSGTFVCFYLLVTQSLVQSSFNIGGLQKFKSFVRVFLCKSYVVDNAGTACVMRVCSSLDVWPW